MARESFKATPADRVKIQVVGTDDLPDRVSVDLDDKDPNNFTVLDPNDIDIVEVDDQPRNERGQVIADPATWSAENSKDPKNPSYKVAKRIERLKAETNAERELRLASERREAEAIRVAQNQKAEIDDLRSRLATNTTTLASSMTDTRKARMADATRRLEQAHAEGNSGEIAKATADMTTAAAELTQIAANTPRPRPEGEQPQRQPAPPQQQQQAPQLPTNVVAWIAANPWFNKDVSKTKVALSIHSALEARGIRAESDDYTRELDKGMKAMYPEHQPYSGSHQDEDEGREQSTAPRRSNAVGPGSRESGQSQAPNPRTVELTSSQLALAKSLNLTPQQYAVSLVKYNANRKGA